MTERMLRVFRLFARAFCSERRRLVKAYVDRCDQMGIYSLAFLAAVAEQGTAWSREVRIVLGLGPSAASIWTRAS